MKRLILIVIAVALIAVGGVWLFQGIGVLPGSVMTGVTRWAVIGSVVVVVGVIVLIAGILVGRRARSGDSANAGDPPIDPGPDGPVA